MLLAHKALGAAVAVGAGTALAIAAPGVAMAAPLPPAPPGPVEVEVESAPVRVAKGAAVTLDVAVTCPASATANVAATLTQRAGSKIAFGTGFTEVQCTGEAQSVTLLVVAAPISGRAFKPGEAVVEANAIACTDTFPPACETAQQTEIVRVQPK